MPRLSFGPVVTAFSLCAGLLAATAVLPLRAAAVDQLRWPGTKNATVADERGALGANISGVVIADTTRAWAVRDSPGELLELVRTGSTFTLRASMQLHYLDDGSGSEGRPDAEAVTVVPGDPGVYIGAERDSTAAATSRNSVLRVVVSGATARTTAEWDLTRVLPATVANQGIEGLAHVPDAVLVDSGFRDGAGRLYRPGDYPDHGAGLFVVGLEQTGELAFLALAANGEATLVTLLPSGVGGVMDLAWSPAWRQLWVQCDDHCNAAAAVWSASPNGFAPTAVLAAPTGLNGLNVEGLALAPACTGSTRLVLWADDLATGGNALRSSTLPCGGVAVASAPTTTATKRSAATVTTTKKTAKKTTTTATTTATTRNPA